MILRYNGIALSQEMLVKRMSQSSEADAEAAGMFEVWLAMNPDLMQEIERRKVAWVTKDTIQVSARMNLTDMGQVINSMSNPSSDEIVQEISSGNPVVLALHGGQWGNGHVVLAYEIEYSRLKPTGKVDYQDLSMLWYRFRHRFQLNKVKLIDPSPLPKQSQYLEIGAAELKACKGFAVGRSAARKQLEAYMKVYLPTPDEMPSGRSLNSK
jgi:hypothetical protein